MCFYSACVRVCPRLLRPSHVRLQVLLKIPYFLSFIVTVNLLPPLIAQPCVNMNCTVKQHWIQTEEATTRLYRGAAQLLFLTVVEPSHTMWRRFGGKQC